MNVWWPLEKFEHAFRDSPSSIGDYFNAPEAIAKAMGGKWIQPCNLTRIKRKRILKLHRQGKARHYLGWRECLKSLGRRNLCNHSDSMEAYTFPASHRPLEIMSGHFKQPEQIWFCDTPVERSAMNEISRNAARTALLEKSILASPPSGLSIATTTKI